MAMKVRYTVVNGQVLSENRNGVERDYIPDSQGNTVALMDSTGTLTDTFSYFPSGAIASRTGTTPTPFQHGGGYGYYRDTPKRNYVRARNFYVNLGRWSTPDPIGFEGGDFNLYRYVDNRFVNATDPSGLQMMTFVNRDFISIQEDRDNSTRVQGLDCFTLRVTDYGPLWIPVPINPFGYAFMQGDHRSFFEEGTSRIKTNIQFDSCKIGNLSRGNVQIYAISDPSEGLYRRACLYTQSDRCYPTATIIKIQNWHSNSEIHFKVVGTNPHVPIIGPPIVTEGRLKLESGFGYVKTTYDTKHTRYPWRDAWLQRGSQPSVCRGGTQCTQIYKYAATVGDVFPGLSIYTNGVGGNLSVETPVCGCNTGGGHTGPGLMKAACVA